MPEYLAPGVYVEETSFRAKSIEGVGTSTTAFVGPTRRGPVGGVPEMVTSLTDFEHIYGSLENLGLADVTDARRRLNFVAHAVRAYFDNGGSRLYVMRTVNGAATAAGRLRTGGADGELAFLRARFPGAAYNGRVRLRESRRPATVRTLGTAPAGSVLSLMNGNTETLYTGSGTTWADSGGTALSFANLDPEDLPANADSGNIVTLAVDVDADGTVQTWEDLGLVRTHPRWIATVLAQNPQSRAEALANLVWADIGADIDAFELLAAVRALPAVPNDADGRRELLLGSGEGSVAGTDGSAPTLGAETTAGSYAEALAVLTGIEDVSIVAAPGSSAYADGAAIAGALIGHAERRRAYRIAVLDCAPAQTPGDMRTFRGRFDSKYAALYYPWVMVSNPLARPGREDIPREIALPPSGFVTGIYARNDIQRGVYKAPANEVVTGALRFEIDVNFAQQELLNPLGVNCLRYLSGRGYRVWGARLASSDPEWKYVSDRRYFNYLEASIDRGTQWAVFEPNGERLWANVRQTIADFLYNEWRNGALLGTTVDQAFFVRCDRSTMTQNDLDNGRLVCLIGVAIIKPAEFVIFRIGQKTADAA
ncbi:phage tail sheath subtilisin-like domain-containing protein [Ramlibacter alkalitolerans]|uniref:Phage tail sheath family protein n=1 Tax=Ramlibacter alkalitolerans TaxID=2039631 RepID=A0ABS1JJJ5_9BURK|nr:phage tail sheath subtilisin-like domain-containing protein [Ramlibacter alkalitolerans]MBL0423990.1 phage tail sheath family protein [Ramlibacter alkalitolerans]